MALVGTGAEYDKTFTAGDSIKTSTAQYLLVGIEPTTTSADFTAYITGAGSTPASTITSRFAIGINQTMLSATSNELSVRMLGISKAKCATTVTVGQFFRAYDGASTTTFAGHITPVISGLSISAATASISSQQVIMGRVLEDGNTGTVVSVVLIPQLYDTQWI